MSGVLLALARVQLRDAGVKKLVLVSLLASATVFSARAAAESSENWICSCGKHHFMPAPRGDLPGRKYARDKLVDVEHLKLDVTPDFKTRSVAGTATLSFSPIARPLPEWKLDAVDLDVSKVEVTGAELAEYQNTGEHLIITFRSPVPAGAKASVTVTYRSQPEERGLYFRTPEMGYPATDTQLWTQGEAELHRFWFPGYDYPNERFTSEVICHVPEGMEAISNGKLLSQKKGADGLVAWHWLQDQPHVNYLVALAAGYFHKIEDKHGDLPLAVFVPPSDQAHIANTFQDTKKIIAFFEKEIGVPFPWAKYYQVYCHDFAAGGMENTSSTFMAQNMIFPDETEQLDSVRRLDAHETAHQWFGDLVTCRDWSHLWLNEGFASYYTNLYDGEKFGSDGMAYGLWREAQRVIGSAPDTKPIVWRDYGDPMHQFDYRAYPKGSWVLHMIRSQLGPELFRKAIKSYLEEHRYGIVTTEDLQKALEETSGLSFDRFFDQWVYHGGVPELAVDYAWDGRAKQVKLTIKQTQKVTDEVPVFHFPLPVRFTLPEGKIVEATLDVEDAAEEFYIPLAAAPELVRLDPGFTVLAKMSFTPPGDLLKRQLTQSDMIGRLLAVQAYGDKKDDDSAKLLGGVLTNDPFWAVREEAVRALRKIDTGEARRQLLAAPAQPDARVRQEWVRALGALFTSESQARLIRLSTEEKNPEILATIVAALGAVPEWPAADFLAKDSWREAVSAAAIQALRAQDQQTAAPAVLARLQAAGSRYRTRDYAAALDALAFLARNQPDRGEVRRFLTGHLTHARDSYRAAAAKALGTLDDPAALAVLQPLAARPATRRDPLKDAAEKSIQLLQSRQTGAPSLQNLVQRLQEQQKRLDELQEKLQKLEKKTEPVKVEGER